MEYELTSVPLAVGEPGGFGEGLLAALSLLALEREAPFADWAHLIVLPPPCASQFPLLLIELRLQPANVNTVQLTSARRTMCRDLELDRAFNCPSPNWRQSS